VFKGISDSPTQREALSVEIRPLFQIRHYRSQILQPPPQERFAQHLLIHCLHVLVILGIAAPVRRRFAGTAHIRNANGYAALQQNPDLFSSTGEKQILTALRDGNDRL